MIWYLSVVNPLSLCIAGTHIPYVNRHPVSRLHLISIFKHLHQTAGLPWWAKSSIAKLMVSAVREAGGL